MAHPIGIVYEHPQWFRPLFAELDRRGVAYTPLDLSDPDFGEHLGPFDLVLNRMSPSAWTRGHADAIERTRGYLRRLEDHGVPVLNGSQAFAYETSKVRQIELFSGLGIRHPRSVTVDADTDLLAAAAGLDFPLLVKPNIGGSGAGMQSFAGAHELEAAAVAGDLTEISPDGLVLLQEHLSAAGDSIVRIEILGDRFLYAIRIRLLPGSFNLCPADYCELPGIADGVSGRGLPIEGYEPPPDIVDQARRIVEAAGMDLGGVEYLIGAEDGHPYFYDVNALSNFVADAPTVIGFDPFVDLVDFLVDRVRLEGAGAAVRS
ncbi:MAG: hypothetical protein WEA29_08370 [Acidimicrobiia bacterium]